MIDRRIPFFIGAGIFMFAFRLGLYWYAGRRCRA